MKEIRLVVLSGPSGAGKSTAIKVLEDVGFFCVDNLPVTLLLKFLELISHGMEISKVAVVVDVREREFLKEFPETLKIVKREGYAAEVIYLEASTDSLIRRFSETRRRHPLSAEDSPVEGIKSERELLKEIRLSADKIIDTSHFNVHELKDFLKDYFSHPLERGKMNINLVSFGYRYGIPADADMVMDVRFIPNPYFIDEFKGLDGRDERVKEFVFSKDETKDFLKRFKEFLAYLIPLYRREGKSYLTIAIGCTGGRHRSVVIVDYLFDEIATGFAILKKRHRDIDKA